jgi:(p)ppGpp synthase/HD superfamily hydrolase
MLLSQLFEQALVYATKAHCNQTRKQTGIPYIAHILGVTAIAMEFGADEAEAIGALLHDTVEDCGGAERLKDIKAKFGENVANIVEGCTDADETPKPPWLQRKEKYLAHLSNTNASTRLVSAADKLHNARAIVADLRKQGLEVFERFKGKRDGTLWYYRSLVSGFRKFSDHRDLVDELDRVVTEIEKLARDGM